MKTRNWKLCTLAIFIAVCFTFYANDCYPQGSWTSQYSEAYLYPGLIIDDLGPIHYPTPYPGPIYGPDSGLGYQYDQGYPYSKSFGSSWGSPVPVYGWVYPAGKAALDMLKNLVPGYNLTFLGLYGREYEPTYEIVSYDYPDYSPYPGQIYNYLGSSNLIGNVWNRPEFPISYGTSFGVGGMGIPGTFSMSTSFSNLF